MALKTQTKWLIGCGGCLTLVILLAVVLSVLLVGVSDSVMNAGKDWWGKTNAETVESVFGKTPPAHYKPIFAIPMPIAHEESDEVDMGKFIVMQHDENHHALMVVEARIPPGQEALIQDPDKLADYIMGMISRNASASQKISDLEPDGKRAYTVNHIPENAFFFRATTHQKGVRQQGPIVISILSQPDGRATTLLMMGSPKKGSTDFSAQYKNLSDDLIQVVQTTQLATTVINPTDTQQAQAQ